MKVRPQARLIASAAAFALALGHGGVSVAAAQGKSGNAPGKNQPRPGGGVPTTTPGSPTPAVASLTTWLDDASPLMKSEMWVGLSVAHWKTDDARTVFAPILFASGGVSSRVSAGATAPVYHQRDVSGASARGVGDVTLFGKLSVRDPATHRFGFALTPVAVVYQTVESGRRVAWGIPISLERRMKPGRVYGSAGYFSTGSVFANVAGETWLTSRVSAGAVVGITRLTGDDVALPSSRRRIDLSTTVSLQAAPGFAVYGSVGKAFTGDSALDGGPWIAGGVLIRHVGKAPK